jgi:uncharacterized protein with HEPN domain
MSRDKAYLLDILEAAKLALGYVSGKSLEQFLEDTQCQDAVIRRLAVIGEAARRISSETKAAFSHIAWDGMTAMRNMTIHEHDDVDLGIVWETVQKDLPRLVAELQKLST